MSRWPMDKNLPDPKFKPPTELWQLEKWQEATGRQRPQRVEGPLMPAAEVGQVLMALGRKTLPGLKI